MFSQIYDMKIEMEQYKIIMKEHIDYPIYIVNNEKKGIIFENNSSKSIQDQLVMKYKEMNLFFIEILSSVDENNNVSITGEIIELGELFFKPVYKTMKWLDNKVVILLILVNITSEKLRVKVNEEASKFKDLLLASVSHDLRTPLNCIINMIDISLLKIEDLEIRTMLMNARESCQLLLAIINDLLDYSQMNANKINIREDFFEISEVVDHIYNLFNSSMKEKKLDFRINFSSVSNLKIKSDKSRLERVLINLISNAQKFTRQGFIELNIIDDQENEKILFNIIDSGIGIKVEDKNKLFKLFTSFDEQGLNSHGVGLGLTISNMIIEKLNEGFSGIKCESEYGVGSKFSFSLSRIFSKFEELSLSNYNPSKKLSLIVSQKRLSQKSNSNILETNLLINHKIPSFIEEIKNVLIIEDEQTNITAMKTMLNIIGLHSDYAYNGLEALNLIKENNDKGFTFDLIISDINMPIMNGLKFIRILRETYPEYFEKCFFVACSANASNTRKLYEEAGFDKYLEKPINLSCLKNMIESLK